jgi:hypothetical protein
MRWALFDRVAIIDWSASSTPSPARPSADAIWIGVAGDGATTGTYFRTRAAAEAWLGGFLDREQTAGRRVLLGFDFPFGYPAGFAAHLTGQPAARAIWAWLAAQIVDGPDNANNRFAIAAAINGMFGGAAGPFWGCPAGLAGPDMPARKQADYAAIGLPERRLIEAQVPRAQPVWKLYTTGSVGSQALMGLPMIHRLAARDGVSVWPFDAPGAVTLAEVYPSLLAGAVTAAGDAIKDRAQVQLLAQSLLMLSRAGRLHPLFDVPGIAHEEGWILGAGHGALLAEALTWT